MNSRPGHLPRNDRRMGLESPWRSTCPETRSGMKFLQTSEGVPHKGRIVGLILAVSFVPGCLETPVLEPVCPARPLMNLLLIREGYPPVVVR